MTEEQGGPATKLVVDRAKFMELAAERGFQNVEAIADAARDQGRSIGSSTIYQILGNSNFHRDSLEKLAQVTGIPLSDFVSFENLPDSPRRG